MGTKDITKLAAYLSKVQNKPFKYGTLDCAIFTVSAVDSQIGTKLKSKLFGKYKDLKGVAKRIKEIGKGKYIHAIEKICKDNKFKEISPDYAQRGDVCIMKQNKKTLMGIIGLNNKPVFIGKNDGLVDFEKNVIERVWRIE